MILPDPGTLATSGKGIGALLSVLTLGRNTRRAIKRNNKLALREYEDFVRWARDDARAEAGGLEELIEALNADNLFYSSHRERREAELRASYAHRWRDRKSKSERLLEDLRDSENVAHKVWRWLRRSPWPTNPYGAEIAELAAAWEEVLRGVRAAPLRDRYTA